MKNQFWWNVSMGLGNGAIMPFLATAALAGAGLEAKTIINISLIVLACGTLIEVISGVLSSKEQHDQFNPEKYNEAEIEHEWELEESRMKVLDLNKSTRQQAHEEFRDEKKRWLSFIQHFDLNQSNGNKNDTWISVATIAISYFLGGLIAIHPFFNSPDTQHNFKFGLLMVGLVTLLVSMLKSRINEEKFWPLFFRTEFIVLAAAMAAYLVGKTFG